MKKVIKTTIAIALMSTLMHITSFAEPMHDVKFISANSVVYYKPDCMTQDQLATILDGYNKLPDIAKTKLQTNNVRVYIYPKSDELSKEDISFTAGRTRSANKIIATDAYGNQTFFIKSPAEIYIYSDMIDVLGNKSFIHEIGHAIDDLYDTNKRTDYNASSSEAFISLSNKYNDVISGYDKLSQQNAYSDHEIYAECFRILVENPGYLYQNAPELFDYMVETVTQTAGSALPISALENFIPK